MLVGRGRVCLTLFLNQIIIVNTQYMYMPISISISGDDTALKCVSYLI